MLQHQKFCVNGLSRKLPGNLAGTMPLFAWAHIACLRWLLLSNFLSGLHGSCFVAYKRNPCPRRTHLHLWQKCCTFRKSCVPSADHACRRGKWLLLRLLDCLSFRCSVPSRLGYPILQALGTQQFGPVVPPPAQFPLRIYRNYRSAESPGCTRALLRDTVKLQ